MHIDTYTSIKFADANLNVALANAGIALADLAVKRRIARFYYAGTQTELEANEAYEIAENAFAALRARAVTHITNR